MNTKSILGRCLAVLHSGESAKKSKQPSLLRRGLAAVAVVAMTCVSAQAYTIQCLTPHKAHWAAIPSGSLKTQLQAGGITVPNAIRLDSITSAASLVADAYIVDTMGSGAPPDAYTAAEMVALGVLFNTTKPVLLLGENMTWYRPNVQIASFVNGNTHTFIGGNHPKNTQTVIASSNPTAQRLTQGITSITLDEAGRMKPNTGSSLIQLTKDVNNEGSVALGGANFNVLIVMDHDFVEGGLTGGFLQLFNNMLGWIKGETATSTVKITLAPNGTGASVSPTELNLAPGSTYGTALSSVFTFRPGYIFAGWYSNSAGTGTQVTSASTVPSSATTLYAKWTSGVQTTAVTLNKSSGTGGTSSLTATNGVAMPKATAPTRSGYVFMGYWDASTGGNQYYNADMSSAQNWDKTSSSATLYARWGITITFNANGSGASVSPSSLVFVPGTKYGTALYSVTATRTGNYEFDGWYSNAACTGAEVTAASTVPSRSKPGLMIASPEYTSTRLLQWYSRISTHVPPGMFWSRMSLDKSSE